jgi:hypothetical protein
MFTNTLGDVMLSADELVNDGERILLVIAPIFFFNGGHIFFSIN